MNAFDDLDRRLHQLGRELTGRPSFVDDVMAAVGGERRPLPRRHWLRTAGLAALAASLLVAAAIWLAPARSLYAQALAALDTVTTIHATGFTTRPPRKWPLETPVQEGLDKKPPVDAWYWKDDDGRPRSYERFGPVTLVRDGDELREYQSDVDLLFISKGSPIDYLNRLSSLALMLEALQKEGGAVEDLGTRTENGNTIRGRKIVRRGETEEYWFDVKTNLPASYTRTHVGENDRAGDFELRFAYDKQVPAAVATYKPPQAKHVRYGGKHDDVQIVWRQHVQELSRRMRNETPGRAVAILPRSDNKTFSYQYSMSTPDEKYLVVPLDINQYIPMSVSYFVRQRAATVDAERAIETWRVPKELLAIEFPRADLVCEKDTSWRQWVGFALASLGLEFTDVVEERTYWIATYDGRKLKSYHEVMPPVPYIVQGGKVRKGLVKPGVGFKLRPVTMHELFEDFNMLQNDDCNGRHPIVINETGLPREPRWDRAKYPTWDEYRRAVNYDRYFVASDSPHFTGEDSQAMARQWYQKEFGVTFTEERRPLTMHVVRRKR